MRKNATNLIWGLLLILAGGLFLAQNLGYLEYFDLDTPGIWMLILGGMSVLFFASYFLSGLSNWGWLFPACICAGVAVTLAMVQADLDGAFLGSPILAGAMLPFLVAFAHNRKENKWALVPAWVLAVLTVVTLIVDAVEGTFIGSLVLFAFGAPFVVVYLANRSQWWALIPGLIMLALSPIPLMADNASGELVGAYVTGMIALPFLVIYLSTPRGWWALIPGGIMGSIALMLLFGSLFPLAGDQQALMPAVLFLGWAAVFAILWLRRHTQHTAWALYPALAMAALSLLLFTIGSGSSWLWPLVLIAAGIALLITSRRSNKSV